MTSLESALQEFLLACQADGLADSTVDWYRSLLGAFVRAHSGQSLNEIEAHTLRVYLVNLRQQYSSDHTRNDHARALHKFWRWAAAEYDQRR